jgi:response regulator RpfG family c-di-GMP phosphodiesterase
MGLAPEERAPLEILIISRDEHKLGLFAEILGKIGAPVLTAQSVEDAWECVKAGSVGVVVHDLTYPMPDDTLLMRATRSSPTTYNIPYLFVTRSDQPQPILKPVGDEQVLDAWIVLPCPSQQFCNKVLVLMDVSRQQQAKLAAQAAEEVGKAIAMSAPSTSAAAQQEKAVDQSETSTTSIFRGRLGAFDIVKIMSMLEPLKLTGTLVVTDEKREGRIHFVDGSVRHANMNEMTGPDALFLLFHLKKGDFRFEPGEPVAERTIQGNTMGLLLEGMRQMDEAKTIIKRLQERRGQQTEQPAN